MSQYFPKPSEPFGGDINVKVDLSNYAIETDKKNISHIDTSSFALKSNLSSLKTEVDKIDIDKLVPVSVDLSKLSDAVKNYVVKKTVYDKLVAKVNSINTIAVVLKTKYDAGKIELEKKIPDTSGLVKKQITIPISLKQRSKIPSISGLALNAALIAVENKIPNISSSVKKAYYNTKITEIEKKLTDHDHDKQITTPEFNTLAANFFNARLAETNLVTKTDFDARLSSLNRNITSNKTKHLLVENEQKKLKTLDSIYFREKSHFEEDDTPNYLVFQPIYRYFKQIAGVGNDNYIYYWQSKGLSYEIINYIRTPNDRITPDLDYYGTKTRVEFNGSCLKQDSVTFNHKKALNIYIVYEISKSINISDYSTLYLGQLV